MAVTKARQLCHVSCLCKISHKQYYYQFSETDEFRIRIYLRYLHCVPVNSSWWDIGATGIYCIPSTIQVAQKRSKSKSARFWMQQAEPTEIIWISVSSAKVSRNYSTRFKYQLCACCVDLFEP